MLTLLLGGARSGKSALALQLAAETGRRVLFVATAEALDEEMRARIERHRRERPACWETMEEPLRVAERLAGLTGYDTVVLDCLTLLVSNLLVQEGPDAARAEVEALARALPAREGQVLVVTNEVGLGVVPATDLGRRFRDLLGEANRRLAQTADRVLLLVAGLPLELKRPEMEG